MFEKINYIKKYINKERQDNLYSRHFYRRLSPYITFLFLELGITANATTWLSVISALIGCFLLSFSNFTTTMFGFLFIQFWYLLDHVDGEVARMTKTESIEGIYLDVMTHNLVHPIIYFSFGMDVINSLPKLYTLPLIKLTITPRRILLFLSFIAGLSALIIELSSALRYQVMIAKAKKEPITGGKMKVSLHFRNIQPLGKGGSYMKFKQIIWNIFFIPGAVWFLTLGSIFHINYILIPIYAFILAGLAILSIIIRLQTKIDTIY